MEYWILATIPLLLASIIFGYWQNNNLWTGKARSHTRKECRGVLYWVIEDGDVEKLKQVIEWFDDDELQQKRGER